MLEKPFPEGLDLMEGTNTGDSGEELQSVGRLKLEKFLGDCLLWKGPHSGAGEKGEEFCP